MKVRCKMEDAQYGCFQILASKKFIVFTELVMHATFVHVKSTKKLASLCISIK
jgi:hypothetical protein